MCWEPNSQVQGKPEADYSKMSPFLRIFCVIVHLYIMNCHAVNFTFDWKYNSTNGNKHMKIVFSEVM